MENVEAGAFRLPRGLLYEIRPPPMLAALLVALLGALAAPGAVDLRAFAPFGVLVFLGLYVAHLVDSLVDYHVRHEPKFVYMGVFEDSGGLLSARELATAAAVAGAAFAAVLVGLERLDLGLLGLAGLLLALGHATALDKNPVTVSLGYPVGVLLGFAGGWLSQGAALGWSTLRIAAPIGVFLAGAKIVSDVIDHDADKAIRKLTVPVLMGKGRGRGLGYVLCSLGIALALATAPAPRVIGGLVAAGALTAVSTRMAPERGTLVLVAGGYCYVVALLAAYW